MVAFQVHSRIEYFCIIALALAGPNQIKTFLKEHGCEGVQHVGLYTPNICSAVSCMKSAGLSFISPPVEYYREVCGTTERRLK